jgi:hypothetical protein
LKIVQSALHELELERWYLAGFGVKEASGSIPTVTLRRSVTLRTPISMTTFTGVF